MEKVYFSVIILVLASLCFPIMQNAANDANLTNVGLNTLVVTMPTVLLIILVAIPIYFFMEKRR